jgi:serine/threonine protein kinase
MVTYTGLNRETYRVFDTPFAGGGEGDLFDIVGRSGEVAKIFKLNKRTTERARKLLVMVNISPRIMDQYAWPTNVLYENGNFAGYIMPKIVGKEKLCDIYLYEKRKGKLWTLYLAIAKNLASVVHNVHNIGQVIGDLKPDNILVDPEKGLVTIVDTDSFHITETNGKVHRCGVATPEYLAPELQGIEHVPSAPLPTFTKETDLFALAVLLFSLLMNGAHPFACKTISGSGSKFQPVENISSGTCAYFAESRDPDIDIPVYAPALEFLPPNLQKLFKRAFVDGHNNPKLRPTAKEFYAVLETLETNLKICNDHSSHVYYNGATECPWCNVDRKMKNINRQPVFVPSAMPSGSGSPVYQPRFQPASSFGSTVKPSTTSSATVQPTSPKPKRWKKLAGVVAIAIVVILMVVLAVNVLVPNNVTKEDTVLYYSEGLAAVEGGNFLSHKWGFINEAGEEVIPSIYQEVRAFSEGLAAVKKDDKWGFIDNAGNVVVPFTYDYAYPFSEGLAIVSNGDKSGFIDKNGNEVISLKYDGVHSFSEGLAAVCIDGQWGFIDKSGNMVIPFRFEKVGDFGVFTEGLAVFTVGSSYGFSGTSISVPQGAGIGFIDKTGRTVVSPEYREVRSRSDDYIRVQKRLGNDDSMWDRIYGLVDKHGTLVIPCKYGQEIRALSGSDGNLFSVTVPKRAGSTLHGVFDISSGKEIIPCTAKYTGFSIDDGMIKARISNLNSGTTYEYFDLSGNRVYP